MNNVWFKPFVGSKYQNGGFNGKKILVIGNSHYCKYRNTTCFRCGVDGCHFDGEDAGGPGGCVTFTQDEVQDDKPTSYWNFAMAVKDGEVSETEYDEIWNSFAFYNYLQTAVTNGEDQGNGEHYGMSAVSFWEVMEDLRPDGIIVWGKRAWNLMPKFNNSGNDGYQLKDGKNVAVLDIYHPSARNDKFDTSEIHKEIMGFVTGV